MVDWKNNLKPWAGTNFRSIEMVDCLEYYDGPLTMTIRDADGALLLCHLFDRTESGKGDRFLVVPTTPEIIAGMNACTVTYRQALDHFPGWVADISIDGVDEAWSVGSFDEMPPDAIPDADVTLSGGDAGLLPLPF